MIATSTTVCLVALLSICISIYINNVQSKPYMDEVFHVPQVQQYCQGNFSSWDPMITTFPGTYLASVGILFPVSMVTRQPLISLCTTSVLRSINIFFTTANCYLLICIYRVLNPQTSSWKAALTAVTLTLFPVMYFFTFLYYTDLGAIFCVLMMYYFHLQRIKLIVAVMGIAAILFRQTNIIWLVFFAGLETRNCIIKWMAMEKKNLESKNENDYKMLMNFVNLIFSNARRRPSLVFTLIINVLNSTFLYILVGIGFALFVYLNNGIVVGDRSNHQACLNFPQLFYFMCVTLVFGAPHMISVPKVLNFIRFSVKNLLVIIAFFIIAFVLIHKFTYVHEYLLADNRHYVFYVWSKIYRRHEYVRFALIPVYYYTAWQVTQCLEKRDIFWKIVFLICILAGTVPQKLMEFRYFIIPYLILRLNMTSIPLVPTVLEFILYVIVNFTTLFLFGERPFMWENSTELQRFMW